MGLFILLIANYVACEFTQALVGYDDSKDRWYSNGLFFSWPKELGRYVKQHIEKRQLL